MRKARTTGVIRIVSTPLGEAPLQIQNQWVGIEIPCLFHHSDADIIEKENSGVISGLKDDDYDGYVVYQDHAIAALRQKSPETADHWNKIGFPEDSTALFIFNEESVEVVRPVKSLLDFLLD